MDFEDRVEELYLDLPEPPDEPEYLTSVSKSGKLLFVSGQLPYTEGRLDYKGKIGLELSLDKGRSAVKACIVQSLGVLRGELKSLNKIKRIVHVRLALATGAEFKDHKKVLATALEFLNEIFGPFGKSSAEVIGVNSLPAGAAAQMSMVVEVK